MIIILIIIINNVFFFFLLFLSQLHLDDAISGEGLLQEAKVQVVGLGSSHSSDTSFDSSVSSELEVG